MTEAEIQEQIIDIISKSLRVDRSEVTPESYLETDLGADSLDLVEISMEMESRFNIWLPEKTVLQTATEVFGPGIIERDGYLTTEGKRLLARRLPAEDAMAFQGEIAVKDLRHYFMKVRTWARMVHGLLQYTPEKCEACGGELAAAAGFRMKCEACGKEITLKSGEELNRQWVQDYYDSECQHLMGKETTESAAPTA
jgi:acyl carrier protein